MQPGSAEATPRHPLPRGDETLRDRLSLGHPMPGTVSADRSGPAPPVLVRDLSLAVLAQQVGIARSMCARAAPMPRTRTGRQDTAVVTPQGACVTRFCASRW